MSILPYSLREKIVRILGGKMPPYQAPESFVFTEENRTILYSQQQTSAVAHYNPFIERQIVKLMLRDIVNTALDENKLNLYVEPTDDGDLLYTLAVEILQGEKTGTSTEEHDAAYREAVKRCPDYRPGISIIREKTNNE